MKTRNCAVLSVSIGLLLGLLIYWREYSSRDQVALYQVLLWQFLIWIPWILGFKFLEHIFKKYRTVRYGVAGIIASCLIWLGLHFAWFFLISSNLSPYLGLPESRFGVYRYFFIFWTLIDVGLIWFLIDKLKGAFPAKNLQPVLLELTRGNNKFFCEPSQIYLLVAENYYTRLYTEEGVFVMRRPLKSFYDILPHSLFMKIHRSTIINVNQVSELVRGPGNSLEVIMKDGTRRRVSRSFIKDITHYFKDRVM